MIENEQFRLTFSPQGYLKELIMKNDPHQMNWVINPNYLEEVGYEGQDKLFGLFVLTANDKEFKPEEAEISLHILDTTMKVCFIFTELEVVITYDLTSKDLLWNIEIINKTPKDQILNNFAIWFSLAYIMFRDSNVLRNIHQSAALSSSVAGCYTKINAIRRDNEGLNLACYQMVGETLSMGTFCQYENLFFDNVSPSLDGLIYHQLVLSGGYPKNFQNQDFIYSKEEKVLKAHQTLQWAYQFTINNNAQEFYDKAFQLGHPSITYNPLAILNKPANFSFRLKNKKLVSLSIQYNEIPKILPLPNLQEASYHFTYLPNHLGEHKLSLLFEDGSSDFVVFNVMDNLATLIEERVDYICNTLYQGETPFAFQPISNQGESLGKLNLVLKKNLFNLEPSQVQKVEESAVYYVRVKWFINGNFYQPCPLYNGQFYRPMDFEYIAHLFLLLSQFDKEVLKLNPPSVYLDWASAVFNLRINPSLHHTERGKEEAQMLGGYFLYIEELLTQLKKQGLTESYQNLTALWQNVVAKIDQASPSYKAAITEHFYDNAGFGPSAGALSEAGFKEGANRYGELLLANIGYGNDFRVQNPDRWWEALSPMIHALWGGITAASCYKVYQFLKDTEYLKASYRATVAMLYCYDTHSTTTLKLEKGMAASTYSVSGPHLNRPDLSRQRFGQATFFKDGGIFARLFSNDTQTPDWDMGEELVAYLESFGQNTFVLKSEESIEVINGSYTENEQDYTIYSFAPYNSQIVVIDKDRTSSFKAINGCFNLNK